MKNQTGHLNGMLRDHDEACKSMASSTQLARQVLEKFGAEWRKATKSFTRAPERKGEMKVRELAGILMEIIENGGGDIEVCAVDDYVRLISFDRVERYTEHGKEFVVLTPFPMSTQTP